MSAQQSPTRIFMMLPLLFLMGKIDFENPTILNTGRMCFFAVQLLSLALVFIIKQKIENKHDMRKIYVPAPKKPFADPNAPEEPRTETTYYEHESAKVREFLTQTLIGAVISSVIHFKFEVNQVVVLQSFMIPFNLYENPLVKAYIFGKHNDRVWDEKLEGDDIGEISEQPSSSRKEKDKAKTEKKQKKLSVGEEIVAAWEATADADFDRLFSIVRSCPNAKDSKDGWNALMVACGSPVDTTKFIEDIIKIKIDVTAQDNDGWTALHWCAFHDRPEAAKTLLSASNDPKLVEITANDGRTALELAKDEGNDDVIAVIEEFTTTEKITSPKQENSLRQRKPAESEATSIGDVD